MSAAFRAQVLLPALTVLLTSACLPERLFGFWLGPPGTMETQVSVDLYFQDVQKFPVENVWRIKSTAVLGDAEPNMAFLPNDGDLVKLNGPLVLVKDVIDYTVVAGDKRGTVYVRVEGVNRDGRVVARGSATQTIAADQDNPLDVPLRRACDVSADCVDEEFCDEEFCNSEGICERKETCPQRADGCLAVSCDSVAKRCIKQPDHLQCQTLVSPDSYCSIVAADCLLGEGCSSNADCNSDDLCQPQVCNQLDAKCTPGTRVDIDDANRCTVDSCDFEFGVSHTELSVGTQCSVEGDPERRVCKKDANRQLVCLKSECPDGVLDFAGGEQCDDGNFLNDDFCTELCRSPRCGDGFEQTLTLREECDDGNDLADDDCIQCFDAKCGDTHINLRSGLEECDDGAQGLLNDADGCDRNCQSTRFITTLLLGCPANAPPDIDAGPNCVPLTNVQDISPQTYLDGGAMLFTDDYAVADNNGIHLASIRTPQVKQRTVRRGGGSSVPQCDDTNPRLTVVPDDDGAPDTLQGVEGITYFSNELVYRSKETGDIYQLKLDQWGTNLHEVEYWAYVAGEYGVVECCPADYQFTWRGNRCNPCREVVPEKVPVGLEPRSKFNFLEAVYTVASEPFDRAIHIIAEDGSNCPGQEPNVKLSVCGAPPPAGVDGGRFTRDGGIIRAPLSWRHIGVGPNTCLTVGSVTNSAAMVVSEPLNHRVIRLGINIPGDLLFKCMSGYEVVAGTGSPGNGPEGNSGTTTPITTPTGVGQDELCNIFFADTGNNVVRQVTPERKIRNIATLPGLRSLVVHPTLGVLAFTGDAVYRLVNE